MKIVPALLLTLCMIVGLAACSQDGDIENLKNIVDGVQAMTVYKNVSDEADVALVVAQELLAGSTPDAGTCSRFSADASFDTETINNGMSAVPSFLLVPYSIDRDNLDLLLETGRYVMGADGYLAAA